MFGMPSLRATASRPFGLSANPRRQGTSSRSALSLSAILPILLLAAAWVFFAPAQVGGQASFVIINGNSMEPGYHRGDLVIVRTVESYQVGDIVAYRDPDIGPVIHRIVEEKDDRFVLQGDNNSWLDSYLPTQSEIIGKSFIHTPSAGKLLEWMRGPIGLAVMVLVVGGIAIMAFDAAKNEEKQPRGARWRRAPATVHKKGSGPAGGAGASGKKNNEPGVLNLLVMVMVLSLLLGGFAFSRSASTTVSEDIAYEHEGEFSYSAKAPNDLYDGSKVRTGEPVFRKVSQKVNVRFDYRLASDQPTDAVEGTYRLVAEVGDVNGWKRTVSLTPETRFTGGQFTAKGTLDLPKVQSHIDRLEKQTGLDTDRYALSIVPEVSVKGTLAGGELDDEFSPRLDFWLEPLQLQLQTPTTDGASESGQAEGVDPLKPSEEASTPSSRTEANTISILGFDLGVPMARKLSLLGLALSLSGLLWFGLSMLRALRGDEPTRIRARYAPLLVSVSDGDLASGGRVVEVAAFEDLVKIAEKSGQSILHQTSDGTEHYYVQDIGVSYHYWAVDQEADGQDPEISNSATRHPEQ